MTKKTFRDDAEANEKDVKAVCYTGISIIGVLIVIIGFAVYAGVKVAAAIF